MRRTPLLPTLSLLSLVVACGPASQEPASQGKAPTESVPAQTPVATKSAPAEDAPVAAPSSPMAQMTAFIEGLGIDKGDQRWRTKVPMPPKLAFEADKTYYWQLETSEGLIKIKLLTDIAPMHVSSTIYLTELGYYDGLKFHRVIQGFMAQGGCPLGTGTGGPGYKYAGEFSPKARHDKPGLLSMANAGPGTDGSQFFLTFVPTQYLDDKHTIFGEVVGGMDVLKQIESFGSKDSSGRTSKPLSIRTAKIVVE
jgi:peptidyl-prolyl cis-trans isomerase B (cyclophilin B)